MKALYARNYKTLLKRIKKKLYKCKDIPYSQTGRLNIVKMSTVPKAIYKFSTISEKSNSPFPQ